MIVIGTIKKEEGVWWSAAADALGAFTQGRSRRGAVTMLKDLVEMILEDPSIRVTVTDVGMATNGLVSVFIECSDPGALAAKVLRYQREVHGLSLADVSKVLGISSRNAYARYEQGKSDPTLGKFNKLLAAVAPEMSIMIGQRRPAKAAARARGATKARAAR